jgi:hypothetical protein
MSKVFRNQETGQAQDIVYSADVDFSHEASGLAYAKESGQARNFEPMLYSSWKS